MGCVAPIKGVVWHRMKITSDLFQANLKCPTKCWLRAMGESSSGNTYAEWVNTQNESYRVTRTERLVAESLNGEVVASPAAENLKAAKWRLATNLAAPVEMDSYVLESHLHAVERVPSEGRGKPAQFVPIRFIFRNKLTKDDRLLLALDALLLSQVLGREVSLGKIIHGDDHVMLKVRTSALAGEVRKCLDKIAALFSNSAPPDLVLNRHCAECEFQARCRKIAVEKDDLSLLAGMNGKERQKLRSKGIFTVTQLSYTFRPRRRPKRLRDKREKYHHSLKALAIREKKIHIVGSPELKIEGTPIYLDVEGLPDRDFYYLIGVRIGNGESAVQHSLWADTVEDEGKIWREFLGILETVEKPVLIHYGSYETKFFEQMGERYGVLIQETLKSNGNQAPVNVLSLLHGQIYFPTYSNGLKDIGSWLGCVWSEASPKGLNAVAARRLWEQSRDSSTRFRLVAYNVEDCQAVAVVTQMLPPLRAADPFAGHGRKAADVVYVESLKTAENKWGNFVSPFKEFERIAQAAWWNYQRDRIYVKSNKPAKINSRSAKRDRIGSREHLHFNKVIVCPDLSSCPFCKRECIERSRCTRTLYDLHFGRTSVKRWIAKYQFRHYWCGNCNARFGEPTVFWPQSHFGRNLVAYVLYQTVDLRIPFVTVQENLSRFFGISAPAHTLLYMKKTAGKEYKTAYESILHRLAGGDLLHADETQVSIRGKTAYIWVFSNLHDVAYLYTQSREGGFLHEMFNDFKGVLVSDFYAAYDSLKCEQQKCLVHLMRDLNDDVLGHPYDEDLKLIVREFATLLKPIVETVDRWGLKCHFLRKHRVDVKRFYRRLAKLVCRSEQAIKCKQRFEKNRNRLFTFLNHDDIPWNNNNAEHAVKAFAKLRDIVRGSFTEDSVKNYLVLLSICQTCKYMGVDFLDFLRSGEKDIYTFAESRRGRRHRSPATNEVNGK